ncbi:MAG: tRNA preQ1(34) S-adenosylmethionine ribosyltransferase-isomerase QueA [Clostridia bacterium]|nr:tRNA preQ1(34) S-adenosylmethionine ribosyltransferase-isomerase QueA [Clostridia bacterium]
MRKSEFYYELPQELIAQHPLGKRDSSRLLVLDKNNGEIRHTLFSNITGLFNKGDCLVLNETKVIPARLLGHVENSTGKMELLLLKRINDTDWEVLTRPGKKALPGKRFVFGNGILKAQVLNVVDFGNRIVRFEYDGIFEEILDKAGLVPLPPYITEKLDDNSRYQTVYAKSSGSSAAPTAGLHFTDDLLKELERKGVEIVKVTLHVGIGTFRPVKTDNIEDHIMHTEHYEISREAADLINKAKHEGRKVIACGTTSLRVLEGASDDKGILHEKEGETDIFIYPGYKFKVADRLITNFHLPESTLIMLVSALAGKDNVFRAYTEAIKMRYRFFSFGDAMFIID